MSQNYSIIAAPKLFGSAFAGYAGLFVWFQCWCGVFCVENIAGLFVLVVCGLVFFLAFIGACLVGVGRWCFVLVCS
jgi:hypothetical protein